MTAGYDIVNENVSHFNSWWAIILSSIFWFGSYRLLKDNLPEQSPEFCCRILSFFHGLVVSILGAKQCLSEESPFYHPEWQTTNMQSFVLALSLGYFVYDLGWCMYYNTETKLMICHHVYSIMALFRLLGRSTSGPQAVCGLGSMEITNPFLQARWFIRTAGWYPSLLFNIIEAIFISMFFLIRILIGGYYIFVVATHPMNDWEFVILSVVIYLLSCMFMMSIVKYISVKYWKAPQVLAELK